MAKFMTMSTANVPEAVPAQDSQKLEESQPENATLAETKVEAGSKPADSL